MKRIIFMIIFAFSFSDSAFAAHPLITDDAGTQGKGKFQFELNGEYGRDSDPGFTQSTTPVSAFLTYGVVEPVDVSIGIPYVWTHFNDAGERSSYKGFGDLAVSLKWRFYENEGLSLAIKPGLTFPTGDENKELGTGKITYNLFFITTKEIKPWAFHLNLGYISNQNKIDQRTSLWHASIAAELAVAEKLKLVANTGLQSNTAKGADTPAAFILGGLIYSLTENIDLDAGYKHGLTSPEVDNTILAGLTFRF